MSPSRIIAQNGTEGIAAPGRQSYKIASIPADGIGPEVIAAGVQVLEKLAKELDTFDLSFTHFDWSSDYYKKHGKYLPDDALDVVREYNAILFGAVGAPGMSSFASLGLWMN
jgi:isocitrate/isopropylmalate dehydrogenase